MMVILQEKPRKYDILRMLIDEYVDSAEPIGSEMFCSRHKFAWSPATVRNDFSELEEEGYLTKPHVSGGRIPTNKAYQKIRDELIDGESGYQKRWNPFAQAHTMRAVLGSSPDRYLLATRLLAGLTHHFVLAGVPEKGEVAEFGLSSLVREPEFSDQEVVVNVAQFIERVAYETEHMMGKLLQETLDVYIGEENTFSELKSCSLLLANFRTPRGEQGFIGILGPTRMPYGRNIAFLEQVADALGKRI